MPRLTGFRLGFRNQCGQQEREEREALGPSRSRVEFPQKWPVGRGKTAWWQRLRHTESVVGRNECVHVCVCSWFFFSHKDRKMRGKSGDIWLALTL